MLPPRHYTLTELMESTGFERRTIVYYIASGLLPKVGRQGPHTRYPHDHLTRLLFIKGVRALQADGLLLTATLAELRRALATQSPASFQALVEQGFPLAAVTALLTDGSSPQPQARPEPMVLSEARPEVGPFGARRSYGLADAAIRQRVGGALTGNPDSPPPLAPPSPPTETGPAANPEVELGQLLRELELRPSQNGRRSAPGAPEQWTEIPITGRVYLSVRGLAEDDGPLAEAVARLLKRALRTRPPAPTP